MIVDTKKCNVKYDGEVLEYVYNLVERTLSMKCGDREEKFIVYGVEAISYVKRCDKMDMLYREEVEYISPFKYKALEFIEMLSNNNVSPIHLLDITEEVIDDFYRDFDKLCC
ncbi:MAG: DUF6514 family protein [Clostridium sp.]|nr:DUF6514 family protein [Clostridium sp.]